MYLKKLYHYNKTGFFIFLLLLMAFIIINYKQGAVATPLYLYGMYSAPRQKTAIQKVYQLSVNGRQLDMNSISFAERDLALLSPLNFELQRSQNPAVYHSMKHIFSITGISKLMEESAYSNTLNNTGFEKWYASTLSKILGYPVKNILLTSRNFIWKDNILQPIGEPVNELTIAIEQ